MLREEKQYYTFDYLAGAALLLPLTCCGGGVGGWEICLSRTSPLSSLLAGHHARQANTTLLRIWKLRCATTVRAGNRQEQLLST